MSKKRFSEGLDDLFSNPHLEETRWATAIAGDETAARPADRRNVGKNFMADLDSLLQEALEDNFERYDAAPPGDATRSGKTKSRTADAGGYRAPMTGLDALIRQTGDLQEMTADEAAGKRRLTVAVDKIKVDKLKAIAKLENSYLKDLLVGVLDDYIADYKRRHGIDL